MVRKREMELIITEMVAGMKALGKITNLMESELQSTLIKSSISESIRYF